MDLDNNGRFIMAEVQIWKHFIPIFLWRLQWKLAITLEKVCLSLALLMMYSKLRPVHLLMFRVQDSSFVSISRSVTSCNMFHVAQIWVSVVFIILSNFCSWTSSFIIHVEAKAQKLLVYSSHYSSSCIQPHTTKRTTGNTSVISRVSQDV